MLKRLLESARQGLGICGWFNMFNKKHIVTWLLSLCFFVVILTGAIFSGLLPYIYYRIAYASISDPEQGWAKKAVIIDNMSKWPWLCANFANANSIAYINRDKGFSFYARNRLLARKGAFINKPWHSIDHQIKVPVTHIGNAYIYIVGGQDASIYRISFIVNDQNNIVDLTIEEDLASIE